MRVRSELLVGIVVALAAIVVAELLGLGAPVAVIAEMLASLLRILADSAIALTWLLALGSLGLLLVVLARRRSAGFLFAATGSSARTQYRSDVIEGMRWSWDWDGDDVIWLTPHCAGCDGKLEVRKAAATPDPQAAPVGGPRAENEIHCPNCKDSEPLAGSKHQLYQRVEAEIRRRIRTGAYRKAATTAGAA